ncbi:hypothetical protein RJ639_037745 [Escallonia herrerae]|uniref:MADS-box domain-containing protein n=1 Tax=Escallonia herrerae TaxID=1293975 RepID=A0AA89B681_9ASTE|nr:hypothetical protein RJ639_037745 [Escallonia herrerae]
MGRTKLEIKKIEDKARRQMTFTKRQHGLYKKAGELATKCGAQVAVIAFSNASNVFVYGHPAVNTVLRQYEATTWGGGGRGPGGEGGDREQVLGVSGEAGGKKEGGGDTGQPWLVYFFLAG